MLHKVRVLGADQVPELIPEIVCPQIQNQLPAMGIILLAHLRMVKHHEGRQCALQAQL